MIITLNGSPYNPDAGLQIVSWDNVDKAVRSAIKRAETALMPQDLDQLAIHFTESSGELEVKVEGPDDGIVEQAIRAIGDKTLYVRP